MRAFLAKGVEASTASTIETAFCDALSKQSLEVVCSEDVKALFSMRQTDLGLGNCESEEECTKQVAKISEAGKVVTGEVSKLGDQYIVSATLIGRLAVAKDRQGQRLGAVLLADALRRSLASAEIVGSSMIVVDALDEGAAAFYAAHGFVRLPESLRLVLPMRTVERLVAAS